MSDYKVIRRAAPNRWPIRMVQFNDGTYVVEETDPDGYWEYTDEGYGGAEFLTRAEADKYFDESVQRLMNEPNWEAQEEYDDIHGTIDGYAPWQHNREY